MTRAVGEDWPLATYCELTCKNKECLFRCGVNMQNSYHKCILRWMSEKSFRIHPGLKLGSFFVFFSYAKRQTASTDLFHSPDRASGVQSVFTPKWDIRLSIASTSFNGNRLKVGQLLHEEVTEEPCTYSTKFQNDTLDIKTEVTSWSHWVNKRAKCLGR